MGDSLQRGVGGERGTCPEVEFMKVHFVEVSWHSLESLEVSTFSFGFLQNDIHE